MFRSFGERLPTDLLRAQQVCLHLKRFVPHVVAQRPPSPSLRSWINFVLEAPRYDVYYQGAHANKFGSEGSRLRVKDYNFDAWISEPLVEVTRRTRSPLSPFV